MAVKFVVDSAADIIPSECEKLGIYHIPLTVSFDGTEYRDAVDITHKQFYEKLIESDVLPVTSQATPAAFAEVFDEITANGDTAVVFALSSVLSGTYQSACIAAEDYPGKVFVIDTRSATVGQRLLVQRAFQLMNEGLSVEELVDRINAEKKHVRVLATLDTLEYLKKGGRISAATAFAGGVLSIKPVITVDDGAVAVAGKARGSKNSNNLLRKLVDDCGGVDFDRPYCLAYSGISDAMLKEYIEDSADLWHGNAEDLPIATVGAVIGTHVGPGAIAVAFFEKH